ncbi:MAG: tRNA-uridine aminocarboxypropyltransferase [Myxococcota bacterium]
MTASAPRAVCGRCRRPARACYCAHVTPIPTRTRVVFLQHPREREVAIGTARMASLCLPESELHVGVHWDGSAALRRALSDPLRPAALLYPGEGAVDVMRAPPPGPLTLIVVDGTWTQTRKVVRENPALAALPRYAFTPPAPSDYRIRKEPDPSCVSTIEALVHVLGALEGEPQRFEALLAPFRAMVDAQVEFAKTVRAVRSQRPRGPRPKRLPALLTRVPPHVRERAADLVCVVCEANAWPYASGLRGAAHPDELVQCVAHRVATGETFERVVRPEHGLAPSTASHTGLAAERILAGVDSDKFRADWRAFMRDDDILCAWGDFSLDLLDAAGAFMPGTRLDLRQLVRTVPGADAPATASYGDGRAGARLGHLVAVARNVAGI